MILRILVLWLFLYCYYSKADCLPDVEGLCTPGVTITETENIVKTEEDKGTEIITTTTTTKTTTTTTVTNEDSGNILDGSNGYVSSSKEGDMDSDWGGQGPASMPSGSSCYGLGTDKCAEITGSGDSTSNMGVSGMGTTFINTIDISDLQIDKGGEVKYTIEVDKQDAQDRIYMHVSGFNGTTTVFSGTDILSESGVSTGYQSYNGSFDFSGVLNKITVEVGGRDINLAVGPLFDDVTVNVFYNVINTIIEQQITTVEEIVYLNLFDSTELDFATEVFEFNDITVDEGVVEFSPIEPEVKEVSYESVELEIDYEMTFDVEFAPEPEMVMMPPPEIKMEVPVNVETVEAEIQMELEELPEPEMMASVEEMPEPEMSTPEPEPEEPAPQMEEMKEEPEMVEPEPEEEGDEEAPKDTVLEDATDQILAKFPTLQAAIIKLQTEDFKEFVDSVDWISPRPTEFRINLKNGQDYILKWTGTGFQAQIMGKRFYIDKINDYQQALDKLAILYKEGPMTGAGEGEPADVDSGGSSGGGGGDFPGDDAAGGGGEDDLGADDLGGEEGGEEGGADLTGEPVDFEEPAEEPEA